MNKKEILKEYDKNYLKYVKFEKKLSEILNIELENKGLKFQLFSRIKEKSSLEEKINRKGYNTFFEITDILGLRVVVFFQDNISEVHNIIKDNFIISFYDSVDKRKSNFKEFGYKSLHLIIKGEGEFQGLYSEIQIRTILQHAWAEIEHGIGYKNQFGIPYNTKRSFSRISGMLENCDIEFSSIYKSKPKIEININKELLLLKDEKFNDINLEKYINKSKFIEFIDKEISNFYGFNEDLNGSNVNINNELYRLKFFKISDFSKLSELLFKNKDKIIEISRKSIRIPKGETPNGISLYYLGFVLISSYKVSDIINYLNEYTSIIEKDIMASIIKEMDL